MRVVMLCTSDKSGMATLWHNNDTRFRTKLANLRYFLRTGRADNCHATAYPVFGPILREGVADLFSSQNTVGAKHLGQLLQECMSPRSICRI